MGEEGVALRLVGGRKEGRKEGERAMRCDGGPVHPSVGRSVGRDHLRNA